MYIELGSGSAVGKGAVKKFYKFNIFGSNFSYEERGFIGFTLVDKNFFNKRVRVRVLRRENRHRV